jgi:hypothetical protein
LPVTVSNPPALDDLLAGDGRLVRAAQAVVERPVEEVVVRVDRPRQVRERVAEVRAGRGQDVGRERHVGAQVPPHVRAGVAAVRVDGVDVVRLDAVLVDERLVRPLQVVVVDRVVQVLAVAAAEQDGVVDRLGDGRDLDVDRHRRADAEHLTVPRADGEGGERAGRVRAEVDRWST